jgi:hypothetical protein
VNWLWQIFDPANIGAFVTQFQTEMAHPAFWVAVGKIIWINVLLSATTRSSSRWPAADLNRGIGCGA